MLITYLLMNQEQPINNSDEKHHCRVGYFYTFKAFHECGRICDRPHCIVCCIPCAIIADIFCCIPITFGCWVVEK